MHIDIAGHHVEITEGLRQAINQKFEKIQSHYPQINECAVTLTVEPNAQIAEINTHFMGTRIAVQGSHSDMYAAIAEAAKKLDAKLAHKKGAANSHRPTRASGV